MKTWTPAEEMTEIRLMTNPMLTSYRNILNFHGIKLHDAESLNKSQRHLEMVERILTERGV